MGYTFNGDAPISGLTEKERLILTLGRIVKSEQRERASEDAQSKRKHSKRKDTYQAAEEYVQKHNLRDRGYD